VLLLSPGPLSFVGLSPMRIRRPRRRGSRPRPRTRAPKALSIPGSTGPGPRSRTRVPTAFAPYATAPGRGG